MHLDLHLCSSLSRHPAAKLHTLVLHGICKPNNQIECRAHSSGSICPVPNTSGTPHCTYLHMLLSAASPCSASVGRTSTSSAQSSRKMVPKGPLQSTKPMDLPKRAGKDGLISIVPEKMAALPSLNLCKAAKPQSTKKKTPELTPAKLRLQLKDQGISAQGSVLEHTWTLLSSAKNMEKSQLVTSLPVAACKGKDIQRVRVRVCVSR